MEKEDEKLIRIVSEHIGHTVKRVTFAVDASTLLWCDPKDIYWTLYEGWRPRYDITIENLISEEYIAKYLDADIGLLVFDSVKEFNKFKEYMDAVKLAIEEECEEIVFELEEGDLSLNKAGTDRFEYRIYERFKKRVDEYTKKLQEKEIK